MLENRTYILLRQIKDQEERIFVLLSPYRNHTILVSNIIGFSPFYGVPYFGTTCRTAYRVFLPIYLCKLSTVHDIFVFCNNNNNKYEINILINPIKFNFIPKFKTIKLESQVLLKYVTVFSGWTGNVPTTLTR